MFIEQYEKLQKENREAQINYFQVRQQLEELQEKMKFFTKESAVDFQELEEALIIVKVTIKIINNNHLYRAFSTLAQSAGHLLLPLPS